MTDATAFWDKVAPKYAQDPIKDMEAYEYTLGRTKSYLSADDRVLELGCGTGSTALLLAPHVREIVGTDISPAMIGIAQQKAQSGNVRNATFRAADAEDVTQDAQGFDAIMGFNLFHLVPDAEQVFADVHRMLPKGGLFISKTPCLGDPSFGLKRFALQPVIKLMQLFGKAPYVRSFTNKEVEAAITFAGFEIVEAGSFPAISRYIVARKR